MRIFLLRHGECEANAKKLVCGSSDSKLTKKGVEQTKKLVSYFNKKNIDSIYSSPLSRALEAAQKIAKKYDIKMIIDERLKEINFGNFEGKSWKEVYKKMPNWREIRHQYKPKNGETQKELDKRVLLFLNEVISKHKIGSIIIVGHGSINKAILGRFLGINFKKRYSLMQSNGCINIVDINGEDIKVRKLNYTSHLSGNLVSKNE